MDDQDVETLDLPPDLTPAEIGLRLRDRYDETMAAAVADLLVQGYTIDQIEIINKPPQIIEQENGLKTLRVSFTVRGRRPAE